MREVPIILDDTVPPNTMYMLNPSAIRHEPVSYEQMLSAALDAYTPQMVSIVMGRDSLRWLLPDPWDRADRNPIPTMILCPRVEALRLRCVRIRTRLREAWDVLLHGLPECEEDW